MQPRQNHIAGFSPCHYNYQGVNSPDSRRQQHSPAHGDQKFEPSKQIIGFAFTTEASNMQKNLHCFSSYPDASANSTKIDNEDNGSAKLWSHQALNLVSEISHLHAE